MPEKILHSVGFIQVHNIIHYIQREKANKTMPSKQDFSSNTKLYLFSGFGAKKFIGVVEDHAEITVLFKAYLEDSVD